MIKGTNDTRYAYVNGIIRAREARLLTRSHFDRLISSKLSGFATILSDSPYIGQDDIVRGFALEEERVGIFFKKYCQHIDIIKFINWPQQIHNIKVKLKQGGDELLYSQPISEVEEWPEVVGEIERFAMSKDPFIFSTNLDRILCKYLYATAKTMPFFEDYFQIYFDLENIRSFFRARQFENTRDIFNQVFIDYGSLSRSMLLDNIAGTYDTLGKHFFTTPYAVIFDKGGTYIEQNSSFLRLERMCEEMKLRFLLMARRMTFGVEPLFTYYQFKLEEIKKLRQVYWGKLNEVPIDDLKESIPDVW
jgi:vacuolar-type H+-ATPase subunit C/Vma6